VEPGLESEAKPAAATPADNRECSNLDPIRGRLSCLNGFPSLGRCRPAGASILTCRHPSWLPRCRSVLRSRVWSPRRSLSPTLRQRHPPQHHAATDHRCAVWLKSHSILHSQHRPGAVSRARVSLTKRPSATSTGCRTSSTRHRTAFVDCHALLSSYHYLQTTSPDLQHQFDAFAARKGCFGRKGDSNRSNLSSRRREAAPVPQRIGGLALFLISWFRSTGPAASASSTTACKHELRLTSCCHRQSGTQQFFRPIIPYRLRSIHDTIPRNFPFSVQ
jgi:hypothetical protein